MKKTIKVLALLLTINTMVMAQEKQQRGFDVTKEITINVSADELWELVGPGFENAYLWASTVDHSTGNGAAEFEGATCNVRSCDLNAKGFDNIEERLTKYNEAEMNLAYVVTKGMPRFVTKASNDWQVVSINDNQSKLVMNGEFRVKGLMGFLMKGVMKKKMSKLLTVVLNDAKVYAETGSPSKIKKERMDKLLASN
jgi:hypothetical protein